MKDFITQEQADILFSEIFFSHSKFEKEYGIVNMLFNGWNYQFYFYDFKIYKVIEFNDSVKNVSIVI